MAKVSYELKASIRRDIGKGASRRLRHAEQVPAIIYGIGSAPESLVLAHNEVLKILQHESVFSHILTIDVDGKKEPAILKALQRHPYKRQIMHMDFLRVDASKEIQVHVPLHFTNESAAPGVKLSGGLVSHLMIDVEVACLPGHLPEFIEVDVSALNLGESLHLSQLNMPANVRPLYHGHPAVGEHDAVVVTIAAPQSGEVAAETAAPAEAAAETKPAS